MKRIVVLAVALCFVTATSAFAQGRVQARPDFSAKAAGITSAAPVSFKTISFSPNSSRAPKAMSTKKKVLIWTTVGVLAAVVGVLIASGYDSEGGGY